MSEQVKKATQLIQGAKRIVAFTGAGISTESGVPDFRSAGGFLDQLSGAHYTGEEALSVSFFEQYPELFFENYRKTLDFPDAQPNFGHRFFQLLEAKGKQVSVVTQNIDNLHEAAGSSTIFSLHGNATKWKSIKTNKPVAKEVIHWDKKGIAVDNKGNIVRPDIVLYGDQLNQQVLGDAIKAIQEADLLMVIGTSLNVMPAAYLLDDFRGNQSILINQTDVAGMDRFDVVVKEKSGQFLQKVWHTLTQEENT